MIKHLFLCDSASSTGFANDYVQYKLTLKDNKGNGDIRLDVPALTKKMIQKIPPIMHDLLEIATFVYVADQMVSRGRKEQLEYGNKWNRNLNYVIPVRNDVVWNTPSIRSILEEALSFVSGDCHRFNFVHKDETKFPEFLYLGDKMHTTLQEKEVVLFSGGLDSFTGALDEVVGKKKSVALVSHRSNNKLHGLQSELHDYIDDVSDTGVEVFHVGLTVNKSEDLTHDRTQRTRSFLFGSLGAAVAIMFKKNSVKFYENGIISCNLPFDGQTPQARRTRSTHPKFLHLFSNLLTKLTKSTFTFENPYFWKTKTDVVLRLKELQHQIQIENTRSCAGSIFTYPHTHCGACSQCIDRRFATISGGVAEYDPKFLYMIDLFTGARIRKVDQAMAAGFVSLANEILENDLTAFYLKHSPELSDLAVPTAEIGTDGIIKKIHDLHVRHANQLHTAIGIGTKENLQNLMNNKLPSTCLLCMILGGQLDKIKLLNVEEVDIQLRTVLEQTEDGQITQPFEIDLNDFNKGPSKNLLEDLIARPSGVNYDEKHHGKQQPDTLKQVLRRSVHADIAKCIYREKNKIFIKKIQLIKKNNT